MKRGYLLPRGCKDLIDVLNLNERQGPASGIFARLPTMPVPPKFPALEPESLPEIKVELVVQMPMTVRHLADQLGQVPFKIIADLMGIGVFASVSQVLSFEAVSIIARQYGFIARKAN